MFSFARHQHFYGSIFSYSVEDLAPFNNYAYTYTMVSN